MTLRTLQIGMEWFSERPGGLNRVYANLLTQLAQSGVDSRGLVAGSRHVEQLSAGLAHAFAESDAPLLSRMRGLRGAALPWLRAHRDAVIVSHFALHALPLLDKLDGGGHPFVVHFQGPWGAESRLERASRLSSYAKEVVERQVYQRAGAVIVLSGAFADILESRFGVERERIHVIPGGVESARFSQTRTKQECRAELGWPSDRPIVLCVRRLVRRVGLDALIATASDIRRRVPDALILIAGAGPMRAELEAQIAAHQLEDSVRLVGFLPDEQLPLAYRAADLTVVPSIALEGFGLITVESLASGTPCIVTPTGGLSEIITPFAPQLVTASVSAADIGDTLSGALRGEIPVPSAEECATYARAHFDWAIVAQRVRAVYEGASA
jgi:glycosyltransferase involved in cell wall biosynthesis